MGDQRRSTQAPGINILQQGQGFSDGSIYNIAEYKNMADRFYNKWLEAHHGEPLPEEGNPVAAVKVEAETTAKEEDSASAVPSERSDDGNTSTDTSVKEERVDKAQQQTQQRDIAGLHPAQEHGRARATLAKDYWEMVVGGTGIGKRAIVDYANDLDTTKYCSGLFAAYRQTSAQNRRGWRAHQHRGHQGPYTHRRSCSGSKCCCCGPRLAESSDKINGEGGESTSSSKDRERRGVEPDSKAFSDAYRRTVEPVNMASSEGRCCSTYRPASMV